ncbi:MAG: M23 family metallopeptidase [Rhizobiales bacterium]|nr:M23 family metallopeptidase [Hyphomicrobiales bacterium]
MDDTEQTIAALGSEPPLVADGRTKPPDRREISARWLSGTFLTGVTSSILMGVALLAALDGREQLATPPEIADITAVTGDDEGAEAKTVRIAPPRQIARARDRRRFEISTVSKVGDRDVIRMTPFVDVKMALAAGHTTNKSYPPFDPLDAFSESGAQAAKPLALASQIYGEKVESEMTGVKIVQENVTVAPRELADQEALSYAEDIIPFTEERGIVNALADSNYAGDDAKDMAAAIGRLLNTDRLKAGTVLRIGLEVRGDRPEIKRTSVYDRTRHLLTIARDDRGQLVPASEPEPNPEVASAFDAQPKTIARGNLPSVYDGIYRAAFSYGLSGELTRGLIRLLASDVDFQSRLDPNDRLEVLFSQPDEDDKASPDSELLYVAATFGGTTRTFYRFQMEDGSVDYFDKDGKSSKQFLLRNPVPNGRLTSGFGARRHPILGYVRMHTGTDWAAPIGTPIIATGNGVVEKAGWSNGYGRQTVIRHPNGYETSYNHQSAFAKGVQPGARIRQGQVIGYVGSTGLSTGAHLHYELIVNGNKVDAMRVRLPTGRTLTAGELTAFKAERDRIDSLLKEQAADPLSVASAKVQG